MIFDILRDYTPFILTTQIKQDLKLDLCVTSLRLRKSEDQLLRN